MKVEPIYIYDTITQDPELASSYDARSLEAYQKRIKFQKDYEIDHQVQLDKDKRDREIADETYATDNRLAEKNLMAKFEAESDTRKWVISEQIKKEEADRQPDVSAEEQQNRSSTTNTATKISGEIYKI